MAAAEHHTPVVLELGGKSASIVFADADPAVAGKLAALFGVIQNSGQGCFLPTRLLVERPIHDDVVEPRRWRPRPRSDSATRSTRRRRWARVAGEATSRPDPLGHRAGAGERGGDAAHRWAAAGRRCAVGAFIEPTVFGDVDPASPLAQEEIFGPVLAVIPFDDVDEAIEIANATRYGLAGYVWTNDLRRAHRVADALDAGYVSVNGMAALPPGAPFGGWKASGHGVEGGRWGVHEFVRLKNVHVTLR